MSYICTIYFSLDDLSSTRIKMPTEFSLIRKFNDFKRRYSNWNNQNKNNIRDSISTQSDFSSLQRSVLLDFDSIQFGEDLIETINTMEGRNRSDSNVIKCQIFEDEILLDNSVVFPMNGKNYIYNFSDIDRKSEVIYQDTSHVAPDNIQEKGAFANFRKFGYFAVLAPVDFVNWPEVERKINFYKTMYEGINIALIRNPNNTDDYRLVMDLLPGLPLSLFSESSINNNYQALREEYQFFDLKKQLIFTQQIINELQKAHDKNLVIVDLSINNILFGPRLEDENIWSMSPDYSNSKTRFRFYLIDGGAATKKGHSLPSEYSIPTPTRPYYVAPECFQDGALADENMDTFSFGVLLEKIFPVYSKFLLNIIANCKERDPKQRIDFNDLANKIDEKLTSYKGMDESVFDYLAELNCLASSIKPVKRRAWKTQLGELQEIIDVFCIDNNFETFKNVSMKKIEEIKLLNKFENLTISIDKRRDRDYIRQQGATICEEITSILQSIEELITTGKIISEIDDDEIVDEMLSRYPIFDTDEIDQKKLQEDNEEDNPNNGCRIS